jgi:hypothetical protein
MGKLCIFTGCEINGENPSPIKKMCLNCNSLRENEPGSFVCTNESVMERGREKILAAVPEGFEIDTLTLKPMALKNPTKRCGAYEADFERLRGELEDLFE